MSKFKKAMQIIEEGLLKPMSDADVKQIETDSSNEFHDALKKLAEKYDCILDFKSPFDFSFKFEDDIVFHIEYERNTYNINTIFDRIGYFERCIKGIIFLIPLMQLYDLEYGKDWTIFLINRLFHQYKLRFIKEFNERRQYWDLSLFSDLTNERQDLIDYLNRNFPKKK